MLDRARLLTLIDSERSHYADTHPRSRAAAEAARPGLLCGVPMTWMGSWAGGFPIYLATARGNRVVDIDGLTYIDFCLGDTGAMAGHSPPPTVTAVTRRFAEDGGATVMLPTEDAAWVAAELERRFGLPVWSFTLSATDANRWAIRVARQITGRPKILVFNYCYHGSVDETFVVLGESGGESRPGNVGPPVDPTLTTRVVEFNDLPALERELANADVAAVLAEPALTNIGIVLPEPGFLQGVREAADRHGTLLIIDETHTFSAGPGGCTQAWGLRPDLVTIGKAIGGGIPSGAYGLSAKVAERIQADREADLIDTGGVGGTLAGNALSTAAMRATLESVLTETAFDTMISLAQRYETGLTALLKERSVPWSAVRLGARVEYRFSATPPISGGQSAAADDPELDEYLHLHTINRGVLLTPFHNMALMCPATTADDVDSLVDVLERAVDDLFNR